MPEKVEVKYCRHCGQLIELRAVDCPYCGQKTIKGEEQKECPFCGELVRARAVKCKHCGEFLDGRAQEGAARQVVNIEKAIITGGGPHGEVEIYRPDGTQISPGPAEVKKLRAAQASRRALPAGLTEEQVGERLEAGVGAVPAKPSVDKAEMAEALPAEQAAAEEAAMPAEVQHECTGCGRYVYASDRFCENCGRDLSLPEGEPAIPVQSMSYEPTDYALMISAAGPAGLFLRFPFSGLVAVTGTTMGLWCLVRILLSGGHLRGAARAVGAIAVGLFWIALIYWQTG